MRQLAAIMFSDMFGYTALMQQNEQLANNNRKRLKEVLETSVSVFNGKILQYYGDGALSIFSSAIDGVNCAVDIQQTLQQEPKVELRIGIHTGDISIENETIYGDGVNLASRIESLAVPGSIFISEKVFDEIRNQENLYLIIGKKKEAVEIMEKALQVDPLSPIVNHFLAEVYHNADCIGVRRLVHRRKGRLEKGRRNI